MIEATFGPRRASIWPRNGGSMLRRSAPSATLPLTGAPMSHVTYRIVRHDEGWAYTANGVFSEPFPTHAAALAAARTAAAEQRVPGHSEIIEFKQVI